jgi:hypothetical protein
MLVTGGSDTAAILRNIIRKAITTEEVRIDLAWMTLRLTRDSQFTWSGNWFPVKVIRNIVGDSDGRSWKWLNLMSLLVLLIRIRDIHEAFGGCRMRFSDVRLWRMIWEIVIVQYLVASTCLHLISTLERNCRCAPG